MLVRISMCPEGRAKSLLGNWMKDEKETDELRSICPKTLKRWGYHGCVSGD